MILPELNIIAYLETVAIFSEEQNLNQRTKFKQMKPVNTRKKKNVIV